MDPKHRLRDLESQREDLINRLHHYQQHKQLQMTLVFDGSKMASLYPHREKFGEIEIVFSLGDQSADDYIEGLSEKNPGSYLVVSSDLQVQKAAHRNSCSSISSEDFLSKLLHSEHELNFLDPLDKEDSGPLYPKVSTKKKGASKKLPRRERKKLSQLKKL